MSVGFWENPSKKHLEFGVIVIVFWLEGSEQRSSSVLVTFFGGTLESLFVIPTAGCPLSSFEVGIQHKNRTAIYW